VVETLAGIAESAHKAGNDLRLLQHHHELEEPFEADQIGSSAMAYKRNPMRAERMCGLARFVMSLIANGTQTTATQWLERTLDDSVNRRLTLPQAFLGTDAILRLYLNVARGLNVYPELIHRNVMQQLPFMATEEIMMKATQAAGDRQVIHEAIRQHSHAAMDNVKRGGSNDLLQRLQGDALFKNVDVSGLAAPERYIGRSPEQVSEFLAEMVYPLLNRLPTAEEVRSDIHV
jgi:adenylosuccinate lyase